MKKQIIKGSELVDKELEVQEDGTLRIVEKGRYFPKADEPFWVIDVFGLITKMAICNINEQYFWFLKHNLVFRTKEECEVYKKYLELLDKYIFEPDWNDENTTKWRIYYDHNNEEIDCDCLWDLQSQEYYFASEEKMMEFVEKAGESNVKKFMFDIWE